MVKVINQYNEVVVELERSEYGSWYVVPPKFAKNFIRDLYMYPGDVFTVVEDEGEEEDE